MTATSTSEWPISIPTNYGFPNGITKAHPGTTLKATKSKAL